MPKADKTNQEWEAAAIAAGMQELKEWHQKVERDRKRYDKDTYLAEVKRQVAGLHKAIEGTDLDYFLPPPKTKP